MYKEYFLNSWQMFSLIAIIYDKGILVVSPILKQSLTHDGDISNHLLFIVLMVP